MNIKIEGDLKEKIKQYHTAEKRMNESATTQELDINFAKWLKLAKALGHMVAQRVKLEDVQ